MNKHLVTAFTLWFSLATLNAAVVPGWWEKVDALPPGTQLKVRLKLDDRVEGAFESSDTTALTLVGRDGRRMQLRKGDVRKVETAEKVQDPVLDGAVKGTAIGALAGGVYFGLHGLEGGPGLVMFGGLVGALMGGGAAIGLAVDYYTEAPEVLYRSKANRAGSWQARP